MTLTIVDDIKTNKKQNKTKIKKLIKEYSDNLKDRFLLESNVYLVASFLLEERELCEMELNKKGD